MIDYFNQSDLNIEAVIYATDFSACSQNAGAYAERIAACFSARLLVVHAFIISQAAMEVEAEHTMLSEQRKDLNSLLSTTASRLSTDTAEALPSLLEGDPKEIIPELAEEHAPSMIVLGTHGGGRVVRSMIGSAAEQILRSTRMPVLTVGPHVRPVSAETFPFQRILFATDFTSSAAQAAAFTVFFAETLGASIDVLNVIRGDTISSPELLSDVRNRFFNALDGLVPHQAKEFCDPKTYVEAGSAHNRILEHIRERSIDLLVLGIRTTSHISMEMRTSGAFQIIVDAQCPVLTIRR